MIIIDITHRESRPQRRRTLRSCRRGEEQQWTNHYYYCCYFHEIINKRCYHRARQRDTGLSQPQTDIIDDNERCFHLFLPVDGNPASTW